MSHFNEAAKQWDSEEKILQMQVIAQKVIQKLELSHKHKIDIMDFGCGTGLFGLNFSDFAKSLTGVDTSEGMLDVFNQKTKGHPQIKSMLIDLENNNLTLKFDLIISSMAFHHLAEPQQMIKKFHSMLNKHGTVAIVDLCSEDGTFHPNNKDMGVKHFGFSESELRQWAQKNELKFDYSIINTIDKNGKKYPQFLALFKE